MKKAGAILIDAPFWWRAYSTKGEGRSARQHYKDGQAMTLDEIKAYPVARHAAPDAFLFSWVPTPFTLMIGELMHAWGFAFSGLAFSWAKQNPSGVGWFMGLGFGTRKNIELRWLGRRGNPKRLSAGVRELIVAPRREHSRKPDEQYGRIEEFCAGPYLELFARQRRAGWMSIGNELDRFEAAS
jgi:N6-adenosine-specific RNA methylase IME4